MKLFPIAIGAGIEAAVGGEEALAYNAENASGLVSGRRKDTLLALHG